MGTLTDLGRASSSSSGTPQSHGSDAEREWARKRVAKKRDFRLHLAVYVAFNAFLIVAWGLTGFGYFWPAWVLGGWGVFVLLDWWSLRTSRPITEEDIDDELRASR